MEPLRKWLENASQWLKRFSAPVEGFDGASQLRFAQDEVMKEARPGEIFAARRIAKRPKTFCNYAVNKQLQLVGVPTKGISKHFPKQWEPQTELQAALKVPPPKWRDLSIKSIGYNPATKFVGTYKANDVYRNLNTSSTAKDGFWRLVPEKYAQEFADKLGASVVAAALGELDPKTGRRDNGHLSLVRSQPQLDLGSLFNSKKGPYLNNIGTKANTGIIPAVDSRSDFKYFVNRFDPLVNTAAKTTIIETHPDFQGHRATESRYLFQAVQRARRETKPGFAGKLSPSTQFLTKSLKWNPQSPTSFDPLSSALTQISQNVVAHEKQAAYIREIAARI